MQEDNYSSPAETLKKGLGSGANINDLFGAMAAAAGFEPHLAYTSNRQYILFDQTFADPGEARCSMIGSSSSAATEIFCFRWQPMSRCGNSFRRVLTKAALFPSFNLGCSFPMRRSLPLCRLLGLAGL